MAAAARRPWRPSAAPFAGALLVLLVAASAPAAGEGVFAPSADPDASRAAWHAALAAGADPAQLDLLREGSRLLAGARPDLVAGWRRDAEAQARAELRLVRRRDLAAFVPAGAPADTPPLLLRQEEGVWRIDLVQLEKSYAPQPPGSRRIASDSDNPFGPLVPAPRRVPGFRFGEVDLLGEPLPDAIARLRPQKDAAAQTRLAEILLRNAWLVDEALDRFEAVARADTRSYEPTRDFAWLAWALDRPERAIPLAEQWKPFSFDELSKLHARRGDAERAQDYARRHLLQFLAEKGKIVPAPPSDADLGREPPPSARAVPH